GGAEDGSEDHPDSRQGGRQGGGRSPGRGLRARERRSGGGGQGRGGRRLRNTGRDDSLERSTRVAGPAPGGRRGRLVLRAPPAVLTRSRQGEVGVGGRPPSATELFDDPASRLLERLQIAHVPVPGRRLQVLAQPLLDLHGGGTHGRSRPWLAEQLG